MKKILSIISAVGLFVVSAVNSFAVGIADLFAVADTATLDSNVKTILIAMLGISLLFVAFRYVKAALGTKK